MESEDLARLRAEVAGIDREIVELVARRVELSAEMGRVKRASGAPIRDFSQEKVVVDRARRLAAAAGLSEPLAERVMLELIRSSLTVQEQDRVQATGSGSGRSVLVIGGAGRMGRWFVRFLRSQGFAVTVADPETGPQGVRDWRETDGSFDINVVAAPLTATREILSQMAESPPQGLIFDVGSLKTPLRSRLTRLVEAGASVTSIHPMFGPDTELLSGRHIVLVDLGVPEATREARDLFSATMVTLVEMDLDSHDRLVAYILGLSHALNIAFFTALAESGETIGRLSGLSSTTFDRQLAVASQVAGENPYLYFEIQHLNAYGDESLSALADAVQRLRSLVEEGDTEGFVALMERGAGYLESTLGG